MDVQTENTDPPPCESQPSGKIRKGFKLFGKRKPGNIFSMRNKGDGNNKSPVKSKNLDGLSETTASDAEQDPDREKEQELSQGEMEQSEEDVLGEDGVLAAAHARTSISSVSSVRSLSFLSLLRGGRKGTADRRIHTVSQPVARQRRGLKGLFGNVKLRSKEKEDKEEVPPSPLLMSSRANSVEIIKEDLTLTPKSHPRSLDSPETESDEPVKSLTTQDSAATTPSETVTPQVTAGSVSKTNEHVSPIFKPPMVPGDNSLSSLLADISSLLTFDSISGGGDIMADVEAEWGKASSAISAVVPEVTSSPTSLFSKPSISSPLTSTSASTAAAAKPSPVAIPTAASTKSFSPLTKTTSSPSPTAKPSTIITTLTKSSTLTTHSVKLSSDSIQTPETSTSTIKSTLTPATGKPSTSPETITSLSSTKTSSPSMAVKSTQSFTSTTTTAPPNTPATFPKPPSYSQNLTATFNRLALGNAVLPSVPKAAAISAAKPPPVTHSPPTPVSFTQPAPAKLDSTNNLNLQTSTFYKPPVSSVAESKAPVTVPSCTTKPSSPAPVISTKMTTTPTTTLGSVSSALSKPIFTSSPMDLNQTPPSLVTGPNHCPAPTKTEPSFASVPTPSSASSDKIMSTTRPASGPVSLDKVPPAPTMAPTPTTHAVVSTASPTPPTVGQIPFSQPKTPPAPAQIQGFAPKVSSAQAPTSVLKDLPAPAQIQVSEYKVPPTPAQIPISISKDLPAQGQVSQSKAPPTPAQIPVSVSKDLPAQVQVSQSKAPPTPAQIPVSVSKDLPAQVQVSQSKAPPTPAQIPVSVLKDLPAPIQVSQSKGPSPLNYSSVSASPATVCIPTYVSKDTPAPVTQSKAPLTPTSPPASCPVTSPPSAPSPLSSEFPASARMTGSVRASVDGQLASQSSTGTPQAQRVLSKTDELQNESRTSLQASSRERRTPNAKVSGLSKIPVVGGGRAGKIPVRESQHINDEATSPVLEGERPHFYSHDAGSKDKIADVVAFAPTSKHTQEESQQPKVLTSLPRDSKIPVKHGASQSPQAKDPPRTRIPVSKVPVRKAGNKPAAAGGSSQMRK